MWMITPEHYGWPCSLILIDLCCLVVVASTSSRATVPFTAAFSLLAQSAVVVIIAVGRERKSTSLANEETRETLPLRYTIYTVYIYIIQYIYMVVCACVSERHC